MIDVLEIVEKQKVHPLVTASPTDFAAREVEQRDSSVVVTDPTVSLYCLDHDANRALFVQVPEDVDVTAAPFLYLAQYEHAQRLLSVPYEEFHRIAAAIELRSPIVFIHSTGRAGSTLMSKAFGAMEAVTSLSEPDVYTQAVALRLSGCNEDEIRDLLSSATKILFNPAFTRDTSLDVVKFRSFCIEVADLLSSAFPDAGNLFLYRDLGAYIRSAIRAFAIDELPPDAGRAATEWLATMSPLLAEELKQRADLDGVEIPCFIWLSAMHAYARVQQEGVPMLGVRYEELVTNSTRMLETIVDYLRLPREYVHSALGVFERDSQAGSPLSREDAARHAVQIDDRRWDLVRDLVRRYPIVGTDIARESITVSRSS